MTNNKSLIRLILYINFLIFDTLCTQKATAHTRTVAFNTIYSSASSLLSSFILGKTPSTTSMIKTTSYSKPFAELSHINLHRGVFDQMFNVGDIIATSNHLTANGKSTTINIASVSNYIEVYNMVKKLQHQFLPIRFPQVMHLTVGTQMHLAQKIPNLQKVQPDTATGVGLPMSHMARSIM